MYKAKTLDEVIKNSVDHHVDMCLTRQKNGFKVLEIDLPIEFATKVFVKLNDEISLGGRLPGWTFGVFSQGEFEGKMAQTYERDGIDYKRFYLRYNG